MSSDHILSYNSAIIINSTPLKLLEKFSIAKFCCYKIPFACCWALKQSIFGCIKEIYTNFEGTNLLK